MSQFHSSAHSRANQFTDQSGRSAGRSGRSRQKPPARKALWAGGSVVTLALLVIVPTRMNPQAVDPSSCQTVVRSGAEISRDQISRLLAVPEGSNKAAVRQVIEKPYCLLPDQPNSPQNSADSQKAAPKPSPASVAREAYPLAFDPTAWVVVNYEADSYVGYDFVFKP